MHLKSKLFNRQKVKKKKVQPKGDILCNLCYWRNCNANSIITFCLCWRAFPLVCKSFQRWIHPFRNSIANQFWLYFLIPWEGIKNPACDLSLCHRTDWSKKCLCFEEPDVSLTAPSRAELLKQRVLNKTRNTTLCWRVALPEKSVCFCEIEIRTLSFFWAAWVGFWGHWCVGNCLVSTQFKARNLVLNERCIRDHHCLLESKQHWRSGWAQPGYNCIP